MTRNPNGLPPVKKNLSLPAEIVTQVELRLYDPSLGKAAYGSWTELLTMLLRRWLDEQKAASPLSQGVEKSS